MRPKAFLGLLGACGLLVLHLDPPKRRPSAALVLLVGCMTNTDTPASIMQLDLDTFRLAMLASHCPGGCVLAQVAVGNDQHLRASGGRPQALTYFGGVSFITWHLRHPSLGECRWSPRHFGDCRARQGFGPAPELT